MDGEGRCESFVYAVVGDLLAFFDLSFSKARFLYFSSVFRTEPFSIIFLLIVRNIFVDFC